MRIYSTEINANWIGLNSIAFDFPYKIVLVLIAMVLYHMPSNSIYMMLKRNKYVGILSIAVTTLQYITISMITIFSMYIAHVR